MTRCRRDHADVGPRAWWLPMRPEESALDSWIKAAPRDPFAADRAEHGVVCVSAVWSPDAHLAPPRRNHPSVKDSRVVGFARRSRDHEGGLERVMGHARPTTHWCRTCRRLHALRAIWCQLRPPRALLRARYHSHTATFHTDTRNDPPDYACGAAFGMRSSVTAPLTFSFPSGAGAGPRVTLDEGTRGSHDYRAPPALWHARSRWRLVPAFFLVWCAAPR